jgi:hypothetical protein
METPPPGWYEDPVGPADLLRWWDGSQWTAYTVAASGGTADAAAGAALPGRNGPVAAIEAAVPQPPGSETGTGIEPAVHQPSGSESAAAIEAAVSQPPGSESDASLTEWLQGTPGHEAGTAAATAGGQPTAPGQPGLASQALPATRNATRVLELGSPPGWRPGGMSRLTRTPIWERLRTARVTDLNRKRLMWALAMGTAVAVLAVGGLVSILGSTPAAHTTPAATGQHPSAVRKLSPSPSPPPSATSSSAPTTSTPVTDAASGLSYAMLSAPWQPGCPTLLSNSAFTWTAGESAVAGTVGSGVDSAWYGSACSGLLGQQYGYTGVADLEQAATNLVNVFDPTYYSGLAHVRSTQQNDPLQVSGHPAWIVKFMMTYPAAASQGLPWQAELGAVVVVDRGTGQAPAVLYVAVPDNLGMANVDVILQSLQMAAPPAATPPAATTPAATTPPPAPPG